MSYENFAMKDSKLVLRAVQMKHTNFYIGAMEREVDSNILEVRCLPSSSTLNAYFKYKICVSFIWELNE